MSDSSSSTPQTPQIEEVPARRLAVIRARSSSAELGETFTRLFPAVHDALTEQGHTDLGAVCAVYHTMDAEQMELSAGIEIGTCVEPSEPLELLELPACEAVTAEHWGPYEQLAQTHEAIFQFLQSQGRVPAGGPIERYITDPELEPDASKWLTEIVLPLQ